MPVLRSGQSGGLEVLQLLRRSVAPSTAPRIVPALRDREPGKSDRLLLVQRPAPGTQVFASPALPGDRRHGGSRGGVPPPGTNRPAPSVSWPAPPPPPRGRASKPPPPPPRARVSHR